MSEDEPRYPYAPSPQEIVCLYNAAATAESLLNAIIEHRPITEIVRELAYDLYVIEMNTVGGRNISERAEDLRETDPETWRRK